MGSFQLEHDTYNKKYCLHCFENGWHTADITEDQYHRLLTGQTGFIEVQNEGDFGEWY